MLIPLITVQPSVLVRTAFPNLNTLPSQYTHSLVPGCHLDLICFTVGTDRSRLCVQAIKGPSRVALPHCSDGVLRGCVSSGFTWIYPVMDGHTKARLWTFSIKDTRGLTTLKRRLFFIFWRSFFRETLGM